MVAVNLPSLCLLDYNPTLATRRNLHSHSSQSPSCDWDQPMQLPPTIDLSDLKEGLTDWEKRLPRPIITQKDDGNYYMYFDGLGVQKKFLHDFKSAIGTGELGPSPVKVPILCAWKDPSTHKHMLCYYKVLEIWEPSDCSKPPPKGFEIIGNDVFYAHLRLVIDQSGKASFKKTLTSLDSISFLDQYDFNEKAPGPAYSGRAHNGGPALGEHFSHLGACRYYPQPGEFAFGFYFHVNRTEDLEKHLCPEGLRIDYVELSNGIRPEGTYEALLPLPSDLEYVSSFPMQQKLMWLIPVSKNPGRDEMWDTVQNTVCQEYKNIVRTAWESKRFNVMAEEEGVIGTMNTVSRENSQVHSKTPPKATFTPTP